MILLKILLILLKIIGILLLVILGLLLLVLLLTCLPIRYEISASKYESIKGGAHVKWLGGLVHAMVAFDSAGQEGKKLVIKVKLAWLSLFDNTKEASEKKKKKSKKKKSKDASETGTKDSENAKDSEKANDQAGAESENEAKETQGQNDEPRASDKVVRMTFEDKKDKVIVIDDENPYDDDELDEDDDLVDEDMQEDQADAKKAGPAGKIKDLGSKLKEKAESAGEIPDRLSEKLEALQGKAENIKARKDGLFEIFDDPKNRRWLLKTLMRLKKLLLGMLPKHSQLKLHFGMDDPASTGKILGYLCVITAFLDGESDITPEFEEKIMEGEAKLDGSFRLISFIIFGIVTVLNRTFFRILKRVKKLMA